MTSGGPRCSKCGVPRSADVVKADPRPPCCKCGATAVSWSRTASDTITVSDSVSAILTPADQTRGWKRRWLEIQRKLPSVSASRVNGMSSAAIHEAAQELMSYFGVAYHLKDALKAELPQGLTASKVERAITTDPTLALLADLANLDKHFVLTNPPRSGDVPRVGVLRSTTLSGGGWQLEMPIEHKGRTINAVELAPKVVESWLRHLKRWGLIS